MRTKLLSILFAASACWSVRADSWFGNQTEESTKLLIGSDQQSWAGKFTLTEAGNVSKITAYLYTVEADKGKALIYDDDGASGEPGTLLGTTAETASITTKAWYDFTFASPVSLAAGDYYLALMTYEDEDGFYVYANSAGGTSRYTTANFYGTPVSPWPAAGDVHTTNKMAIYATYTPSAPPATTKRPQVITISE